MDISPSPFPSFRKYQKEVILELIENLDSYDIFMLEAPPGFGKSAVAYIISKYIRDNYGDFSHICVKDKYLQDQYLHDFSDLALIKGRNNFNCLENPHFTCGIGRCTAEDNFSCPYRPRFEEKDRYGIVMDWNECEKSCFYWEQKDHAIRSNITLHNYPYYLNEQNYIHHFSPRYFGVFDEAHTIESTLMDFISFTISDRMLHRVGLEYEEIPTYSNIESWVEWLKELKSRLENKTLLNIFTIDIKRMDKHYIRTLQLYKNLLTKVNELIEDIPSNSDNWVFTRQLKDRGVSVTFKPVTVHKYSRLLFNFTQKNLLMSATILDPNKLKKYLGITEDVYFTRVSESTFPVEHRPFIQSYIGKATHKTIDLYMLRFTRELDTNYIPQKMKNKGVVHTHSNKFAQFVFEQSHYNNIMLTNVNSRSKREDVFQEFFDSPPPKIMISPSMNLGVDLKDDRCRWQIIAKVPYPDLSDPQIARRLEIDPEWYDYCTLTTLIQTYGRAVRSETDWAETYITDSMFMYLWQKTHHMAPQWFKQAITHKQAWEKQQH